MVIIILFAIIIMCLKLLFGPMCALLAFSILSTLMYVHVSLTSLFNIILGNKVGGKGDTLWKLLLLTCSTVGFSIYFTL